MAAVVVLAILIPASVVLMAVGAVAAAAIFAVARTAYSVFVDLRDAFASRMPTRREIPATAVAITPAPVVARLT